MPPIACHHLPPQLYTLQPPPAPLLQAARSSCPTDSPAVSALVLQHMRRFSLVVFSSLRSVYPSRPKSSPLSPQRLAWTFQSSPSSAPLNSYPPVILFVFACSAAQSCLTLFVTPWTVAHQAPLSMGILQARILGWVASALLQDICPLRNLTQVSHIAGGFFTIWTTREAQEYWSG